MLKCKVTPSQRVSSKPYDVWAIVEKDANDHPGGKIASCYCTCTAGLYGACNHVAGLLLFRVKSAVMTGVTKPTCTDRLARWKIPKAKTELKPGLVSSLTFEKDHYKSYVTMDREKLERNAKGKAAFSPLTAEQLDYVKNEHQIRKDLMKIIKKHAPKSCFAELMEEKKLSIKVEESTPQSILDRAASFEYNNKLSIEKNVENFTYNACKLTQMERELINKNTVGQSQNDEWYEQRKDRMTASQFHRICTRSQVSPSQNATALVTSLLGYKTVPDNAAMKHGRAMEFHAKQKYLNTMKKTHRQLKSEEVGLIIMREKPFIGVSPDLKVTCICCGEGLLEIKCPYSIKETTPTAENLSYLEKKDDKTTLKSNSDYYYQIQGQMAVTERNYTDFFVFTVHGYFLERVDFNSDFWANMLSKLEWFWIHCFAPEILTNNIKKQLEDESTMLNVKKTVSQPLATSSVCLSSNAKLKNKQELKSNLDSNSSVSKLGSLRKPKRGHAAKVPVAKRSKMAEVYLCGVCKKGLPEKPTRFSEESVLCDKCCLWFHFTCVGIQEGQSLKGKWYCKNCA